MWVLVVLLGLVDIGFFGELFDDVFDLVFL